MKYAEPVGKFFLAAIILLAGCTKQISDAQFGSESPVIVNGLTPIPISCLYSPVPAGKVQIPHPRDYMITASTGNSIAFFAGNSLADPIFFGADIYNVLTGTWTSQSFAANQFAAVAACNGWMAYGGGTSAGNEVGIDLVHLLDVNTGLWSAPHLSIARYDLAGAGYGNKMLFAGGLNDAGTVIFYSRVDIYDASTKSWSTAELSLPRYGLVGASANNIVAFAGGRINQAVNTVDFYQVVTGQWSHSALSKARDYISAIGSGSLLFFAGGTDANNKESNICDIYNTVSGTWLVAHMANTKGNNPLVATLGSKVIFYNSGNKIADVYSTCSNTWSTMTLTIAPYLCTAGTAGGQLLMGRNDLVRYEESLFAVN